MHNVLQTTIRARISLILTIPFIALLLPVGVAVAPPELLHKAYLPTVVFTFIYLIYFGYQFLDVIAYRVEIDGHTLKEYRLFRTIAEIDLDASPSVEVRKATAPTVITGLVAIGGSGAEGLAEHSTSWTIEVITGSEVVRHYQYHPYLPTLFENLERRSSRGSQAGRWSPIYFVNADRFISALLDSGLNINVNPSLKKYLSLKMQRRLFGSIDWNQVVIRTILSLLLTAVGAAFIFVVVSALLATPR